MNPKVYEFESPIYKAEGTGGAYVIFPYDIREEFGKGRVKVHATFDGVPYDGSIVNMGVRKEDGSVCYIIGLRKDIRSKIGKESGDCVRVTIKERESGNVNMSEPWTCPKCGRTFKRRNQDHYCGKAPETIDAYIAAQPEYTKQYLNEIRDAIRAALPEAEEKISWSMPTFWKRYNIIQFAGFKNHIGLYTGPEAVEEFKERLEGYKTNKGTIRLLYSEPLPVELIADIAVWCARTGK